MFVQQSRLNDAQQTEVVRWKHFALRRSAAHRAWRADRWSAAATAPRRRLPRSCTSAAGRRSDSCPGSSSPPAGDRKQNENMFHSCRAWSGRWFWFSFRSTGRNKTHCKISLQNIKILSLFFWSQSEAMNCKLIQIQWSACQQLLINRAEHEMFAAENTFLSSEKQSVVSAGC